MSGGVWEYVIDVMTDLNGVPLSGGNDMYHSGFIGSYGEGGSLTSRQHWPAQKYYDTYVYQSISYKYTSRILGDAIGEMGPFSGARYENVSRTITSWYADVAHFLNGLSEEVAIVMVWIQVCLHFSHIMVHQIQALLFVLF